MSGESPMRPEDAGLVPDVDLARDMAEAEEPYRDEARRLEKRIDEQKPYAVTAEQRKRDEEVMAEAARQKEFAKSAGEDVALGPEGIARKAREVVEEIKQLHGLHAVSVSKASLGVEAEVRQRLGVNSGQPSFREGNKSAYSTNQENIFYVTTRQSDGGISRQYWHMTDPQSEMKAIFT